MKKVSLLKKSWVVGIIALFICAGIVPSITGYDKEAEQTPIVQSPDIVEVVEDTAITFYVFGRTGVKTKDLVASDDDVNIIYGVFEELKYEMIHHPLSDETQSLKREFIDLLDEKGLIPEGLYKEGIFSLLNPMWVQRIQNNGDFPYRIPFFRVNGNVATAFLCSMASEGLGWIAPPIIIPRPRIVNGWLAFEGDTAVAELYRLRGFIASGGHLGLSVGFFGAGISFALPGLPPFYGFVGYSLFTMVNAESIERFPPNAAPVISDENPPNKAKDISISLSELSFRIEDADGDLMSYTVTTEPDIGSGSGNNKKNGFYSVPVSGLEHDKVYQWTVEVTDGKDTTTQQFSFITEAKPPFNPFDEGWKYRKKITIDHTKVAGDLTNFPVLVSTTDVDLRDKAQDDGDDILFMDDSGTANKLFHEIEIYDDATGHLITWVNITTLSSNQNTILYMYYGNPSCSNQQFSEKVWDSDYEIVYHISETSGSHEDSTSNNYDGVPDVAQQGADIGKVDGADEFTGQASGSDNINPPDEPLEDKIYQYTVELWYKADNVAGTHQVLYEEGGDKNGANIYVDNSKIWVGVYSEEVSNKWLSLDTTDNEWHYVVLMFDDDNFLKIFHNGEINSSSISGYVYNHHDKAGIGAMQEDTKFHDYTENSDSSTWEYGFDGIIDEFKISKTCRTNAWISTQYNSQNEPTSFLSFGLEETGP